MSQRLPPFDLQVLVVHFGDVPVQVDFAVLVFYLHGELGLHISNINNFKSSVFAAIC